MSEQRDKSAHSAEQANSELLRGLRRCHRIVGDYRSRLTAANSNESEFMLRQDTDAKEDGDDERTG